MVGGGSGGCTIAAKFARKLKKDEVFVLEPSTVNQAQFLFYFLFMQFVTILLQYFFNNKNPTYSLENAQYLCQVFIF